MSTPPPSVPQVPRLTTSQIAEFKRDGLLVLPGVIDPELCRQARDQMWETIAEYRPSMKRDDPSTWAPFTDEEKASYERPEDGGDPYFSGGGRGFTIRNGAEDLLIDIGARSVWDIAEQLLGKGEVVWPAGADESGFTTGPCFQTKEGAEYLMKTHLGPKSEKLMGDVDGRTEELRLPKTGPVWMNSQGTRGMYCTLPNSPARTATSRPGPWPGGHAGEGLYESRQFLQTVVYFDDVPLGAGGTHLWPGSHTRIWDHWAPINDGLTAAEKQQARSANAEGEDARRFKGYTDAPIGDLKADTPPTDCHGPAGSVVLWRSHMLHMAGQNTSSDVIRQATLYAFAKTPESVSDEIVMEKPSGDIWQHWSDEVRATEV